MGQSTMLYILPVLVSVWYGAKQIYRYLYWFDVYESKQDNQYRFDMNPNRIIDIGIGMIISVDPYMKCTCHPYSQCEFYKDHACGTNRRLPWSMVILNKLFQLPLTKPDLSQPEQIKDKQRDKSWIPITRAYQRENINYSKHYKREYWNTKGQ